MGRLMDSFKAYITDDATATAADIAAGKVAYGSNGRIVGTVPVSSWNDGASASNTLLLNFNGTDGSTTMTDSSPSAHTVTPVGNAQLDDVHAKFGATSLWLDGTGDYLTVPYVNADFDWFVEDYTIDCWVYASTWAGWSYTSSFVLPTLIGRGSPTGPTRYWSFGPTAAGGLAFYYYNGAGQNCNSLDSILTLNQWEHIAMVYDLSANAVRLYLNGTEVASLVVQGTPSSPSESLVIGSGNSSECIGWVDSLRITRGVARYVPPVVADFTPPTIEPA